MPKSKSSSGGESQSQNTPQQETQANNESQAVDLQSVVNKLKALVGKLPWLSATFAQIIAAVEAVLVQTQQKMASAPSTCDQTCYDHCCADLQKQRELLVQALATNLCLQHCLDEAREE